MIASIRYLDQVVKMDGHWYFRQRKLMVDWIDDRPLGRGQRGARACDWRSVVSGKAKSSVSRSIMLQDGRRNEPNPNGKDRG